MLPMPISGLALWHRSTCEHLAVEKWSYHSATVASDGWMGTRSHCSLNGFQSCSFSWDRRNPKNAFLMFSHFLMFSLSLSACTQGFLHYTCYLGHFPTDQQVKGCNCRMRIVHMKAWKGNERIVQRQCGSASLLWPQGSLEGPESRLWYL